MNFSETMQSLNIVLEARQVPLLVGGTGIGKTSLVAKVALTHGWTLITIDGNLLKEGEIGGLPTVKTHKKRNESGNVEEEVVTVYAIHHKLYEVDQAVSQGQSVILFIDEINRCEHAVQQELMNLILNREINGYQLPEKVHIVAAMNPVNSYDYEVTEMDGAQENRFVWLYMEADYKQWLDWAVAAGIEERVMEFISTFPEYLNKANEDDINATPRSYERISNLYTIYKAKKETIPRSVFFNLVRGNVGSIIAEEFVNFVESEYQPLVSYEDVFEQPTWSSSMEKRIHEESHTRLYLAARNILTQLEQRIKDKEIDVPKAIERLVAFLRAYPVDLRIAVMKSIKQDMPHVYNRAQYDAAFVDIFFAAYR